VEAWEIDLIHGRWHYELLKDPFSNPNLAEGQGDWTIGV